MSTMTRPWRECSYKQLSKGVVGEQAALAVNQINLARMVSIADIAAEVENDR